jgi:hypothetical protein
MHDQHTRAFLKAKFPNRAERAKWQLQEYRAVMGRDPGEPVPINVAVSIDSRHAVFFTDELPSTLVRHFIAPHMPKSKRSPKPFARGASFPGMAYRGHYEARQLAAYREAMAA